MRVRKLGALGLSLFCTCFQPRLLSANGQDPKPNGVTPSLQNKASQTTVPTVAASAIPDKPESKSYPDGHGHQVFFPLGDASFADKVESFEKGDPSAAPQYSNPRNALGPPDYKYGTADNSPCVLTLGCGGRVVFGFSNNVLVDVNGPDLYIFEVGEDEEDMDVAISEDGRKWIELGTVNGGTAAIDIHPHVLPGEVFHYVRIIDMKSHCDGPYPGADIDAIGAIGAGETVSLKSSILFDYKSATLKAGAKSGLKEVAAKLRERPDAVILIEGHTDNIGGEQYNRQLSQSRALAVRDFFVDDEGLHKLRFETKGYGSTRPVSANTTEQGRELNRRVEIIIMPEGVKPASDTAPTQDHT